MTDRVQELLNLDVVDVAEKVFGKSEEANWVALLMQVEKTKELNHLLNLEDDTKFSETMENHLRISKELGFKVIYEEQKQVDDRVETFYILWHDDGILMKCETFYQKDRNSADIYYNLKGDGNLYKVMSSGCVRDGVLIGHHDVRTGLRRTMKTLRAAGEFLPVWVKPQHLWLSPYWDTDSWRTNDDHTGREKVRQEVVAKRVSQFPEYVKTAILPLK